MIFRRSIDGKYVYNNLAMEKLFCCFENEIQMREAKHKLCRCTCICYQTENGWIER